MTLDTGFLGLIALATTVMAVIQIVAAVYAARAAREATRAARDLMREMGPILANARKVTDDAARVTALALTQVQRLDQFVTTTTARVDIAFNAVQAVIQGPVKQGAALWSGLKAALAFFASRQNRPATGTDEDDDSLFIG